MKAHPNPGMSPPGRPKGEYRSMQQVPIPARTLGGIARNRPGAAPWIGATNGWPGAFGQVVLDFTQATMAAFSRYANDTLSQQLHHVYTVAERTRDCARAVTAVAARDYPEGAARNAMLVALGRQEADAAQLMDAVLRYGREHGHLAFAFPVHPIARPRSMVAARCQRNIPARRVAVGRERRSG
jgi:hypothetical protein